MSMKTKTIKAFQDLEMSSQQLLRILSNQSNELLGRKQSNDGWSLLEVAEHLYLAEKVAADYLKNKLYDNKSELDSISTYYFRGLIVRMALYLPIKFKVPKQAAILPNSNLNLMEIKSKWEELNRDTLKLLSEMKESEFQRPLFKHPSVGKMRLIDGYKLLQVHFKHHKVQIERIQNVWS